MRLVYMDEAGVGNPDIEPYVVVAGVIVHGDHQLAKVRTRLTEIREKYIPPDKQAGFVFHAKEIFNGGKTMTRNSPEWPIELRLEIADQLAAIPKLVRLRVAFGWYETKNVAKALKLPASTPRAELTQHSHAMAFLNCSALIERWMRENAKREHCLLVVEDDNKSRRLLREVQNVHQDPRITGSLEEKAKPFFPFTRIQEDPLFQPKKQSNPLEVADFFAFMWRRFLDNQESAQTLRFINPVRSQIATF